MQHPRPDPTPALWAALAIIAIAALAINLAGLADYPMPHCDEAIHAELSYNAATHGRFAVDMLGSIGGFDQNAATEGRFYHLGQGLLLRVLDESLATARLFSTLGWLVATAFTFLVARRLFDPLTGALSALVFATSLNVFWASHIARHEIWVIASSAALLYGYLVVRAKPSRAGYAGLALLAVAGLEFHLNAVFFMLPIGLLVLADTWRTPRYLVAFAGGGLRGVSLVLLLHFLPDPAVALDNIRLEAEANSLSGGSFAAWMQTQWTFMETTFVSAFQGATTLFTLYAVFGIGAAAVRRRPDTTLLLITYGAAFVLFSVAQPHKNPLYGPLWDAGLAMLATRALVQAAPAVARRIRTRLPHAATAALLAAPLLGANLAGQIELTVKFAPRDYDTYAQAILADIPPGEPTMGDPILWFAFNGRNPFLADWITLYGSHREAVDGGLGDVLAAYGIRYVVTDGSLGCGLQVNDVARAFREQVEAQCQPVAEFTDRWFGAGGQNAAGHPTTIYFCPEE